MSGVFANGLEISGKAVNARTIAAFPDTCFTPPENPATPPGIPVPYPSFGFASDTEDGTGTVLIGGKTVNIKNKSDLSKTSGTEAGCAAKKGVVTSKNTGKSFFHKWSNDVKFDGEPVIRNTDLASHNHASPGPNSPPWVHLAEAHLGRSLTPDEEKCPPIGPYNRIDCSNGGQTSGSHAHHIVPDMCYRTGTRGGSAPRVPNAPSLGQGMCICLTHSQHSGLHSSLNGNLRAMGSAPVPTPSGLASGAASVTGTAPIDDIFDCCADSISTIPNLPDECKELAIEMTDQQIADAGIGDQPGRTTTSLPNADATEVISRGFY